MSKRRIEIKPGEVKQIEGAGSITVKKGDKVTLIMSGFHLASDPNGKPIGIPMPVGGKMSTAAPVAVANPKDAKRAAVIIFLPN